MHWLISYVMRWKFFFSAINFFHCRRIIELLKDTECGEKNIFGQYSSQKMKVFYKLGYKQICIVHSRPCLCTIDTFFFHFPSCPWSHSVPAFFIGPWQGVDLACVFRKFISLY